MSHFTMQQEFVDSGAIKNLKNIIQEHSISKVLLVTGKQSYLQSGSKKKIEKILGFFKNLETFRFNEFDINPKIEDVQLGIELVKSIKPEVIIAIGGGSVIDMAKLINILSAQDNDDEIINYIKNNKTIKNRGLPLVAIPTTAGTGSETTHFAVVYINKIKYSLAHPYILPDYSIIDPELSYSLPSNIIAVSGMDGLSQAVESYWSVKSTKISRGYASKAIGIILKEITRSFHGDLESKIKMSEAVNIAGKAINITKTTAPHAISYPLTTYFNIPHGHAVALTLGRFFIINSNVFDFSVIDSRGALNMFLE